MLRIVAGAASAMLVGGAGFFFWLSRAEADDPVPPAPAPTAAYATPLKSPALTEPPAATEKSKEEKRFARADKDKDGKIVLDELYQPRRKAFAKLDKDGDGRLAFEEWAASTAEKFAKADADRNGALTAKEYASTAPKRKPKPKCKC